MPAADPPGTALATPRGAGKQLASRSPSQGAGSATCMPAWLASGLTGHRVLPGARARSQMLAEKTGAPHSESRVPGSRPALALVWREEQLAARPQRCRRREKCQVPLSWTQEQPLQPVSLSPPHHCPLRTRGTNTRDHTRTARVLLDSQHPFSTQGKDVPPPQ